MLATLWFGLIQSHVWGTHSSFPLGLSFLGDLFYQLGLDLVGVFCDVFRGMVFIWKGLVILLVGLELLPLCACYNHGLVLFFMALWAPTDFAQDAHGIFAHKDILLARWADMRFQIFWAHWFFFERLTPCSMGLHGSCFCSNLEIFMFDSLRASFKVSASSLPLRWNYGGFFVSYLFCAPLFILIFWERIFVMGSFGVSLVCDFYDDEVWISLFISLQ
ncbi:hypothetical protein SUGI_0592280 [Cryptomeria japonica]|nr:hypothetical protein SUGI_0592280 [Cryptomeria japonica]